MKTSTQAKHMALGQLYTNEVTDPRILQAVLDVPREAFVPANLKGSAYIDDNLPYGDGRFLLAPLTFSRLLSLANIAAHERVLVIGGMWGYGAAVITHLASHVTLLELNGPPIDKAQALLKQYAGQPVDVVGVKNLAAGHASGAPYDVILLEGAAEILPEALGAQLGHEGRLLGIKAVAKRVGMQGGLGRGIIARRVGGKLQQHDMFDASAALLPGFGAPPKFQL